MPSTDEYSSKTSAPHLASDAGLWFTTNQAAAGADTLDTRSVLRASQALSSEHDAAGLATRVEQVLGSVARATKVVLALWDTEANDWVLQAEDGHSLPVSMDVAGHRVPLSVLRHAELTAEPVLLADATADPRFCHDPYFKGMQQCALMVVPVMRRKAARAMVVLENRDKQGSFSAARLDAVMMIVGQLAVSLENAQLYERLERKVTEQTRQLRVAQSQLQTESRRAGMAQVATDVLHNVGNVLTSVNVSAHVLASQVRQSPSLRVGALAQLLSDQADLESFFGPGGKGRLLPDYLRQLAEAMGTEREQLLAELERLSGSVDHIKNVVAMQQSHAVGGRLLEPARIGDLVDEALRMQEEAMLVQEVLVQRDYEAVGVTALDKTRVMQILVNLLDNARQAMDKVPGPRRMDVAVRQETGCIIVSVRDCGSGITAEAHARIFSRGFTTKVGGHGFGLHSCVIAAQEMGGSLTAHSEGAGTGATFILRLPALQS